MSPKPVVLLACLAATLAWSDEFDATDLGNWTFETGGDGWGNNELQYYTDGQNAFIEYDAMAGSNVLVIEAHRGALAGASCWYGACRRFAGDRAGARTGTARTRPTRHGTAGGSAGAP